MLYYQFFNVDDPQHEKHIFPLAIFKAAENYQTLKRIAESLELVPFISHLEKKFIEFQGTIVGFQVIFTADWITHCAEGKFDLPNQHSTEKKEVCSCGWCCKAKDQFDVDSASTIRKDKYGVLNLKANQKLYCWGHGVARLLSNILVYFYEFWGKKPEKEKRVSDLNLQKN